MCDSFLGEGEVGVLGNLYVPAGSLKEDPAEQTKQLAPAPASATNNR
jgi:hypothetical protein